MTDGFEKIGDGRIIILEFLLKLGQLLGEEARLGHGVVGGGHAEALLQEIFENAPVAVKLSLQAVNEGGETTLAEGLALEAAYFGLCAGTEDKQEGTSAFLEKRKPHFTGR